MVYRAGAGPPGCPISDLTTDILVASFRQLASEKTRDCVAELSQKMRAEKGSIQGAKSFIRNLPLEDMLCEVNIFRRRSEIARVYCDDCGLKMSSEADRVLHRPKGGRSNHLRVPYLCVKWGVEPPSSILGGLQAGFGAAAYEIAGAMYDLVAMPINGARERGAKGAAEGVVFGVYSLVARPLKGGGILVDRLTQSVASEPARKNRTVQESVKASQKRSFFSFDAGERQVDSLIRLDSPEELTEEENSIENVMVTCTYFSQPNELL
jgi:hypothetical protein